MRKCYRPFLVVFADIDECFNNPCINDAVVCKNTFGSYECICRSMFAGRHCQTGRLHVNSPFFQFTLSRVLFSGAQVSCLFFFVVRPWSVPMVLSPTQ